MIHRTRPDTAAIHPSGWAELPGTDVEITRLPVIDTMHSVDDTQGDAPPLFARLTYDDALAVAAAHGARLPAPGHIEALRRYGLQLMPYLGTPIAETELQHSVKHDADVHRQLDALGWDGVTPVAGAGKHWIDGAPAGRSRLMGWDKDGPGPGQVWWQPPAVAHNRQHHDDGTTTMLVRPRIGDRDTKPSTTIRPPPAAPSQHGPRPPITSPGSPDTAAVTAWQLWLLGQGYPLPRYGADGDHGRETEAATLAYLEAAGLERDGRGGTVSAGDTEPCPASAEGASYVVPFVDLNLVDTIPARHFTRGRKGAIDLIVLHSTENPIRPGVARNVARWFGGPSAPQASAHYVVGPEEIIRGVDDSDTAWAAPGANHNGLQIEMVGQAGKTDWLRAGSDDRAGLAVLERAAGLVAALCRRHGLPVAQVTVEGLRAGARGITSHAAVSAAFRRSNHQDPGLQGDRRWPWAEFLARVEAAL